MDISQTPLRWVAAPPPPPQQRAAEGEAEKWKSLVHRCEGKETSSDPENVDENMRRPRLDVESGASNPKKRLKRPSEDRSFDEFLYDDGDRVESNCDGPAQSAKTRVARGGKLPIGDRSIVDVLRELTERQQKAERRWREEAERRAEERRVFEREWRETAERLERERLMLERAMRERGEEQARAREEARAEKRDALLNALLNKLTRDGV